MAICMSAKLLKRVGSFLGGNSSGPIMGILHLVKGSTQEPGGGPILSLPRAKLRVTWVLSFQLALFIRAKEKLVLPDKVQTRELIVSPQLSDLESIPMDKLVSMYKDDTSVSCVPPLATQINSEKIFPENWEWRERSAKEWNRIHGGGCYTVEFLKGYTVYPQIIPRGPSQKNCKIHRQFLCLIP